MRDSELDAYLADARSEAPGFQVKPAGRRDEYYILRYIEPAATNAPAIGLDLRASDVRRAAAERARDTLRPAITTRIQLVQDGEKKPGFLMLFPVYRRELLTTPGFDRRRALFGWVDVAARVEDIMRNLPPEATQGISFSVYDGAIVDEKRLLYSTSAAPIKFESVIPLELYGQPWAIAVRATPAILAEPDDRQPAVVLAVGLLVSLLSAGIVWSLLTMRRRALALADTMTRALKASEARVRSIVDNVTDGIVTVLPDGRVDSVNPRAEAIFLRPSGELIGRPIGELLPGVDLAAAIEDTLEIEGRSGAGYGSFEAEISVSRMTTDEQERFVVIVRDITERRRSERESHLLQSLSLSISHAQDVDEAFTVTMKELCELARWSYAEAWLPDLAQQRLRPGPCWHRDERGLEDFARQRLEFAFARGQGMPGLVWESKSTMFVRELASDARFVRTAIAGDAGLRAALGVPVLAESEVVAVLVFFAPEATEQIESYTRIVSATASQLGSVILRKRSADALIESHNELQAVFDAATEISVIATLPNGTIRVFNQGAERMLGYKAEEVIGRMSPEVFHLPGEIEQRASQLTAELGRPVEGFGVFIEQARQGRVEEREWTYVRKDGEHLTVTLAVNALHDAEGRVVGFLEIAKDITLRNRAIEELRASESRVRSMIENSLGGLVTCNRRGILESINPAAESMFGYTASELIGRHFSVLLAEAGDRPAEIFTSKLESAIGTVTEMKGRRRNGEIFPFEISLFAFDSAAQTYYAGHILDVSKRHEVDRMKQDFVSTVSHELRTPLTSIRGALGLVASGALGELEPEAKDMISVAERNSVRLISLINDILDFDRLESGRMEMHPRKTSMHAVMQRSIENVSTFADQEGITLEIARSEGAMVADEDRIVQVLVNFLSNAIKFSPRAPP